MAVALTLVKNTPSEEFSGYAKRGTAAVYASLARSLLPELNRIVCAYLFQSPFASSTIRLSAQVPKDLVQGPSGAKYFPQFAPAPIRDEARLRERRGHCYHLAPLNSQYRFPQSVMVTYDGFMNAATQQIMRLKANMGFIYINTATSTPRHTLLFVAGVALQEGKWANPSYAPHIVRCTAYHLQEPAPQEIGTLTLPQTIIEGQYALSLSATDTAVALLCLTGKTCSVTIWHLDSLTAVTTVTTEVRQPVESLCLTLGPDSAVITGTQANWCSIAVSCQFL